MKGTMSIGTQFHIETADEDRLVYKSLEMPNENATVFYSNSYIVELKQSSAHQLMRP
jgi:hypothetical protein